MTTYSYEEVYEILKNGCDKPADLNFDEMIMLDHPEEPHIYKKLTESEEIAYKDKKYGISSFIPKKAPNYKRRQDNAAFNDESVWNVDLTSETSGSFDAKGMFIASKAVEDISFENLDCCWLLKDSNKKILGPFVSNEMEEKMKNNLLDNFYLKRECDKIFLPFVTLKEKFSNPFAVEKNIVDNFFTESELQQNLKTLKISDKNEQTPKKKPAKNIVKKEKNIEDELSESEIKKILENCKKSQNFLIKRNVKIGLDEIRSNLIKMKKEMGLSWLARTTSMNNIECNDFLELLIEESKIRICLDIDKDGFLIINETDFKSKKTPKGRV
ncbi:hypothetical protein CWI39_2418p0010 [Hamiltosporidium magnivora]|uniref:Uncharacterized protein n=2 Tax=Hamiltosporidium magnivora TaxID=148818 RepID=A0A4Q9KV63_9MICR|nr:hypothetical protein CWI39_2418p0010 [Hamiltosporidium magnivora]